jgi:hypothetical protein
MTCNRKKLSEQQAAVVAQKMGARHGQQFYPTFCEECRGYHVTTYYSQVKGTQITFKRK